MKRMVLGLVVLGSISLQAVDKESNEDSQGNEQASVSLFGMDLTIKPGEQVDPLSVKAGRPNWKRLKYILSCTLTPVAISYATARTKYRFAGPISAALGGALLTHRLNKADRGAVNPFWTHSAWIPAVAIGAGLAHILGQCEWDPNNPFAHSLGKMLFHYFNLKS
jgi:hypothetical protein